MPTGELDPSIENVVEYGPAPDGTTVDVSDNDIIDVEMFGAAGGGSNPGDGGRVIARQYDVSDVSSIELVIADGEIGELDGGDIGGGAEPNDAGRGGGLTALKRNGDIELAAHGGGGSGGFDDSGSQRAGGGGAAGGEGGDGSFDNDGEDGESSSDVSDLGGDGGDQPNLSGSEPATDGAGEVFTTRADSTDTFEGGGNTEHEGLVRIEFVAETTVQIVNTNSPVPVGETVEVDVDVTNNSDETAEITVELEVDPA